MTMLDLATKIADGRRSQGRRYGPGPKSRTLALTAAIGAPKRTEQVMLYVTAEAKAELERRAANLGTFASGLGAYLVEISLRRPGGDSRRRKPNSFETLAPWKAAGISRSWWYKRRKAIGSESSAPVACKCGCGETFARVGATGRPREFIRGHNRRRRAVT